MHLAIMFQVAFALLVVMVAAFFGEAAVYSAIAGACVAIFPNMIFAAYLKVMGKPSVIRFFIGEAAKIAVVVLTSLAVWRNAEFAVNAIAYWAALIIVVKVHNFGLLQATR